MTKTLLLVPALLVLAIHSAPAAIAECDSSVSDDWRPMVSAPHDGTTIEFAETYGVAPWYGIAHWSDEVIGINGNTGAALKMKIDKTWAQIDKPGSVSDDDPCLFWRPYRGDSNGYVDPTGGAQNSSAYWLKAIER
jgi:hypothetical protein